MSVFTPLDETALLSRAEDALTAPLEDRLLMLSVKQGSYFEFSPVTRRIWELIESPISLTDLIARLVAEYEVAPDVCGAEVRTVVEGLVAEGLIVQLRR